MLKGELVDHNSFESACIRLLRFSISNVVHVRGFLNHEDILSYWRVSFPLQMSKLFWACTFKLRVKYFKPRWYSLLGVWLILFMIFSAFEQYTYIHVSFGEQLKLVVSFSSTSFVSCVLKFLRISHRNHNNITTDIDVKLLPENHTPLY